MGTDFERLNHGWNADPNGPSPRVTFVDDEIELRFIVNSDQFPNLAHGDVGILRFANCWRFRLGVTNDEGWYLGQCRFSRLAPRWGEFYEVFGELLLEQSPDDWWTRNHHPRAGSRHFLFYFRDDTFECDATDWRYEVDPVESRKRSGKVSPGR